MMTNSDWTNLLYFITTTFLLFVASFYFVSLIVFRKDKSFGKPTNERENTKRNWYFLLFLFTYGCTTLMIRTSAKMDLLTSNSNLYNFKGFSFIIGLTCMILIYYTSKKSIRAEDIITGKAKLKLLPNKISIIEKRVKFDFAISENYFNCNFEDFERMLNLTTPTSKIVWLPVAKSKKKDRKKLLNFLNELFPKQLFIVERNNICEFVNQYFEFNDKDNYSENPLSNDNLHKWIKDNNMK